MRGEAGLERRGEKSGRQLLASVVGWDECEWEENCLPDSGNTRMNKPERESNGEAVEHGEKRERDVNGCEELVGKV